MTLILYCQQHITVTIFLQHWQVFENITELVILVPALLGLKGNLEMTLASRLSTQANLGHMDSPKQQWSMIVGNLTLIQCQAIVVGFLASVVAVVMGAIKSHSVELDHAYLLCASSLVTASVASFVLGLITAAVIVLSRHCNINPDNVATPIAASLGDITSLTLLSWVSTLLYDSIGKYVSSSSTILIPNNLTSLYSNQSPLQGRESIFESPRYEITHSVLKSVAEY